MCRPLPLLTLLLALTCAGCCLPSGDSNSTSSSSRTSPPPKTPSERERLIRESLNSEMWKTVRKMIRAQNPKPSDIYVQLNPPDADSAETAAAADVLFDLRDQGLNTAGYQLQWDTKLDPDQTCTRSVTFGDWKLCAGLALLPNEMADHLPADVDAPEETAMPTSEK